MVRPAQVGRSRGCQLCRARRIKCDLTLPQCQRCLESGRICPGPLTGVLVIESERMPSGRMRGRTTQASNTRDSRRPCSTASEQLTIVNIPATPTLAHLHEDNLLSRFLEFLSRAARRTSWTLKLPDLKNKPTAHALRSSLRAISLAYFAHVTQDQSIQVESYRHYGYSLARQRLALTRLPTTRSRNNELGQQDEIDIDMATNALLAAVILSYFELISPTAPYTRISSSAAYINHTHAAEQIIILLGPQALSHDIIGQLFFSIRSHAVHRASILGQYTIFSEKEWMEAASQQVPKQSYARSAYDRVTEWILKLSRVRMRRRGSEASRSTYGTIFEDMEQEETPESLLAELRDRYDSFLRICRHLSPDEVPLFMSITKTPDTPSTPREEPPMPQSRNISSVFDQQAEPILDPTNPMRKDILLQGNPPPIDCMTTGALAEGPANLSDLHPQLQKQFAAMTTAYYHTAALLMQAYVAESKSCGLCPHMNVGPRNVQEDNGEMVPEDQQQSEDTSEMARFANSTWDPLYNARIIVAAGRYLSPEGKSNGTAVMRMVLPFSVIWHFCRDMKVTGPVFDEDLTEEVWKGDYAIETQRVRFEARRVFEEWCTRERLTGLIGVGFGDLVGES